MIEELKPGTDRYDRVWRLAPSGIEHMEKPRDSWAGDALRSLILQTAGEVAAYCGYVITALPYSDTRGEERPCGRCLRSEFADED